MSKQYRLGLWATALGVALTAGCYSDQSVAGGTAGTLRSAGHALRDVRINVYPAGSKEAIGFGVTGDGGRFELYQPDARGALHLPPGEYALTLEPNGPEPLKLAPALHDPLRTPLRTQWDATLPALELSIP